MTASPPASTGTAQCSACHGEYDPLDPDAVKRHTVPIHGCGCSRCRGKPGCYWCGSSFCFCMSH